jgi:hypothetical protein
MVFEALPIGIYVVPDLIGNFTILKLLSPLLRLRCVHCTCIRICDPEMLREKVETAPTCDLFLPKFRALVALAHPGTCSHIENVAIDEFLLKNGAVGLTSPILYNNRSWCSCTKLPLVPISFV